MKSNKFLVKFLFLFVMVSLSISGQWLISDTPSTPNQQVLARVDVPGMLSDLRLPVYAHMQDVTGEDYALVIASQAQLDQSGAVYRILDYDTKGAEYFIISLDNRNPIAQLENTLLDDGKQIILRSNPKQAETLSEAGFDIRWLKHSPMVLSVPRQQEEAAAIQTVAYDSVIAGLMNQVTQTMVQTYDKNLSGANSVTIGGNSYTIATRNTSSGTPISKATQYVYEFMQNQGLTVSYHNWSLGGYSSRNVIGQKTGTTQPNQIVLITAHLDDMPTSSTAPGADDNASGSVGVMCCAELLKNQQFTRTIRFVFFTGEEQGLYGSAVYSDLVYGNGDNIVGVLNMDMISYDSDANPYLRLHTRTSSNPGYSGDLAIANTFIDVVNAYSLSGLSPLITSDGESRSDHSSFWSNGYNGILGIEDHINDETPYYHTTSDTYLTLNYTYFANFVKAAVGTAAHLAIRDTGTQPPVANFSGTPTTVVVGGNVAFTDLSTGNPTSWSWSFPGGTPSTSTAKNPSIQYNTLGTYNVTLTATNAYGSDDETKTGYITVTSVPVDEIAEAVDYSGTFTKSGNANWSKVTDVYYYGGDSAKSGTITHNQSCSIEITITMGGPSVVNFYWKVSSEANYDFLRFYIDGALKNQISGETNWAQISNSIAAGTHTLKWTYYKDASVSSGSDCGWVDKLEIAAGGGVSYCTAASTNCTEEWIARVRVGTLDKSSTASNYSDFTSIITNYTRGVSQSVTLTPGFSGSSYTEYWRLFIDYNQDGDFADSGETVFSKTGSSNVTGSFTISTSASTGNTRMRVTMRYGAYASSCGTFTYGEVEDYTANII